MREINNLKDIPTQGNALIVFYASWCQPCKLYKRTYQRYLRNNKGLQLLLVDVDNARELTQHYGIRSVPSSIFIIDGNAKKPLPGVLSYQTIENIFREL